MPDSIRLDGPGDPVDGESVDDWSAESAGPEFENRTSGVAQAGE